jgi:hypothetical protein
MENTLEDTLSSSLNFKLSNGASYVISRQNASYFPAGSNVFSSKNNRVLKFVLDGSAQWLDPRSITLNFNIENPETDAANLLEFCGQPYILFRRIRVYSGGVLIEDLDNYNRTHHMKFILSSSEDKLSVASMGFGTKENDVYKQSDIVARGTIGVSSKLLLGIFNQDRYISLEYAPISIEIELDNSENVTFGLEADLTKGRNYILSNARITCDLVKLDSTVENEYISQMLGGNKLYYPLNSCFTTNSQMITNFKFLITVQRSFSKLKGIFLSLYVQKGPPASVAELRKSKENTTFYHPMEGTYDFEKNLEFYISVGSERYPIYPIQNSAEAFERVKLLGKNVFNTRSSDLKLNQYTNDKFIVGFNLDKMPNHLMTGLNTKSGTVLTISCNPKNTIPWNYTYGKLFYTLVYDQIMEISDTGIQVYD